MAVAGLDKSLIKNAGAAILTGFRRMFLKLRDLVDVEKFLDFLSTSRFNFIFEKCSLTRDNLITNFQPLNFRLIWLALANQR